ncbi:MAG: universal stress protein [Chloroflexota bacterium]
MVKHILVPLDQSELAEQAVSHARMLLEPNGTVSFVTVVDVNNGLSQYNPQRRTEIADEMSESADAYLEKHAAPLRADGIVVQRYVRQGQPADVIVDLAEELKVDLIAMSTHGRTGLTRWRFGSVAQKVLGGAPCPVYIIPPKKDRGES